MLYFTGDMHGNIGRFHDKPFKRLRKGDTLVICGDFGFLWEGTDAEKKRVAWIAKRKYCVLFVDGKHENFDLLAEYPVVEFSGGRARHLGGNLYQLLRGEVFTLEGKKLFAFGGGESADKEFRVAQGKWWEEELPTYREMENAVEALAKVENRVDYIITHEPPAIAKTLSSERSDSINTLDAFFDELCREVSFTRWFFGSVHQNKRLSSRYYALFDDVIAENEAQ